MGVEKKSVGTRLDSNVLDTLQEICDKENRSISNLIETIIKEYLRDKGLL